MDGQGWRTVVFCCDLCGGSMLYAHSWPDGRVELCVPDVRRSVRYRLSEPSYHDQRATDVAVERDGGAQRPAATTEGGSVVVSCGRCGSRRPYDPIKRKRLVDSPVSVRSAGIERVVVRLSGELEPDVLPHHRPRRPLLQ